VCLTLVNGNYQKIDGKNFIFIFTDLGSKFSKIKIKKKIKKKLRKFLILEGWLRELLYIFPKKIYTIGDKKKKNN
jgi:hypothetical protein